MSSVFRCENTTTLVINFNDQIYVCEEYNPDDVLCMPAIRSIFGSQDNSYMKSGWESRPWRHLNCYWKTKLDSAEDVGGWLNLNFTSRQTMSNEEGEEYYANIESRINFKLDVVRTVEYSRHLIRQLRQELSELREQHDAESKPKRQRMSRLKRTDQ